MAKKTDLNPIHPGEILREEFLSPLALSVNKLAQELYVPATRMGEIVNERRGITADTALRLARYFGTTPDFWMNLQMQYDLQVAAREIGKEILGRVQPKELTASPKRKNVRHELERDGPLKSNL